MITALRLPLPEPPGSSSRLRAIPKGNRRSFAPPRLRRLLGDLSPAFLAEPLGARVTASPAERDGGGVFPRVVLIAFISSAGHRWFLACLAVGIYDKSGAKARADHADWAEVRAIRAKLEPGISKKRPLWATGWDGRSSRYGLRCVWVILHPRPLSIAVSAFLGLPFSTENTRGIDEAGWRRNRIDAQH
jgi:hypothetical protein